MKSEFQTSLSAKLKDCTDCVWIIDHPLKYWSELLNCLIVVPHEDEFFETDFASVPRVPIFYEMWGNRAHREAVLHDYLYRIDSVPVATYSQANAVFLEAMKATGKPRRIRWPMYLGVVLAGWTAYHKKRVLDKL